MGTRAASTGDGSAGAVVERSETERKRGEVNDNDERNESGGGVLNPSEKRGASLASGVSAEGGAGLPRVPRFIEPKAMGPPSSMPPPSMPPMVSSANLPGPMGPPPMRVKQRNEEVKEPVQSAAAEGMLLSSLCRVRKESMKLGVVGGHVRRFQHQCVRIRQL